MASKQIAPFLRFLGLVLLAVGVWALSRYAQSVPAPLPSNAPPAVFSATRAGEVLSRIIGPGQTRFVGSPGNLRARDQIIQELTRLGVRHELQSRFVCSGAGRSRSIRCMTINNIIGHVFEGSGPAVVLMAHYDSVAAGPGAGDDASGVATILESVRAIKAAPGTNSHPLLVLFTDGEEAGLVGARAFLQVPEWRARVGAIVNVEARGTKGQSLLFQTSPGDSAFVSLYAQGVGHYATSSLFSLIYRLLPNDTDLTPFLNADIPGVNFAYIEGAYLYHTALDRQEFLDPVTLQQHGNNVLGITRGLLQADFASLSNGGDAIYLTILGRWLPRLPASWALPLSLLLLAGTVLSLFLRGDARADRRVWIKCLAVAPLMLAGALLAGLLLHTIASLLAGSSAPAYAYPTPLRLALTLGVAAVAFWVARLWSPRVPSGAIWVWPAIFGVLTAAFLPGFSPYFIFPALIATPLLLAKPFVSHAAFRQIAIVLASIPALFVWLGMTSQGEGVMGLMIHPLFTMTAAFGVMSLIPLLELETLKRSNWLFAGGLLTAGAIALAVWAGFQPSFSADAPQRLNLAYLEDHTANKAQWSAGELTPGLRAAAQFSEAPVQSLPLNLLRGYVADAGRPRLEPPRLEILSDRRTPQGRILDVKLSGSAGAASLSLGIPASAKAKFATIDGREMAAPPDGGDMLITCLGRDCNGVQMTLMLEATQNFDFIIAEQRFGLPPEGEKLKAARGNAAVPSQTGDVTIVLTKAAAP